MAALGTRRASSRYVPRARQFGRTSAPMVPHFVQIIFGPNDGTVRSTEVVDVHDHFVPALVTLDRERPHAIGAHVAEVHRLDRIVETPGRHKQKNPALGGDKF
jgi:hypothetical protein